MSASKQYTAEAKKTATRYALFNVCLQILLLVIIVQCVWLARMGVHSLTQAKQHVFLLLPAYEKAVYFFLQKSDFFQGLSPFVWPYVPYVFLILFASFVFSYRASRALKKSITKENDRV